MKNVLVAVGMVVALGCHVEPDWRRMESAVSDARLPRAHPERVVSAPLEFEEVPDYLRAMEKAGWEFESFEPAGPELPARYLIVCKAVR
ncbi:MAG: hypothetical protein HYY16_16695 [Planctomycetes bacterium]|nr:hypothetical protein [Planctomycetota bacterium]